MNTEEIERTAIHEAGHAVCYALYNFPLWRVEIAPKGLSNIYHRVIRGKPIAGACLPSRSDWIRIPTSKWREYARVGCAGYAAEALCLRTADRENAADDFEQVNRLLSEYGAGVSLEAICIETATLLTRYRSAIRAIADELLASRRLTGQRVKEIILDAA